MFLTSSVRRACRSHRSSVPQFHQSVHHQALQQIRHLVLGRPTVMAGLVSSWIALFGWSPVTLAATDTDAPVQIGDVVVQAQSGTQSSTVTKQGAIPRDTPGVVVRVHRDDLKALNQVTTSEALRYQPDLDIRERFIGDTNALIGGRDFSVLQPARALVYVDGLLISNFLGNSYSYPPKWGVISPDDIGRIDILYGPFSALYPGNSMGSTVAIQTRKPEHLEASVQSQWLEQTYNDPYGHGNDFSGNQQSLHLADRQGAFWYSLNASRLSNAGQPMMYAVPNSSGAAGTPVTGLVQDTGTDGQPRQVAGQTNQSQVLQQQQSLRMGYAFTPNISANVTLAHWTNHADTTGHTFLEDANGNPVYGGIFSENGQSYSLGASTFSPSTNTEEDWLYGLGLTAKLAGGWKLSANASKYDISENTTQSASTAQPGANVGGAGKYADGSGTGWQNLDLKLVSPQLGAHQLTAGVHEDQYHLSSLVYGTSNWLAATNLQLNSVYAGKTQTDAAYVQDVWSFLPKWTLTLGARYERWKAYDGQLGNGTTTLDYAQRQNNALSPKAALAWTVTDNWLLRLSYGAATRFPTVGELFQGTIAQNSIVNNNPNLQPERAQDVDLTSEYFYGNGTYRVSLFQSRIHNAIYQQTSLDTPPVTNYQNIGLVRTRGIELAYTGHDVGIHGLKVSANVSYAQAKILANPFNPTYVGNTAPGIPHVRANLLLDYPVTQALTASVGVRYASSQFGSLDNSDTYSDTYQGRSAFTVVDTKLNYTINRHFTVHVGIDNLTNQRYYAYHPFSSRTFFAGLKWKL